MSQRLLTTDDHSGAEIVSDTDATQASISITRNGVALSWDGLNLTDESWGALTDLLTQFLPGITPSGQGSENGSAPSGQEPNVHSEDCGLQGSGLNKSCTCHVGANKRAAQALIDEAAANREQALATRQASKPRQPRQGTQAATQAAQRERSKSIRAWWYNLPQGELNKLGLPTPKDRTVQIGKMPVVVTDVYAQTVEAA